MNGLRRVRATSQALEFLVELAKDAVQGEGHLHKITHHGEFMAPSPRFQRKKLA
jgi:hypothetical protein